MNKYRTYHTVYRWICTYSQSFFPRRLRMMSVWYSKADMKCRLLAGFAYFCVYAGRTSPRAGHRAGSPRVSSRQAGTLAEEANETVRLASIKGRRSVERARWNPSPTTRLFWVSYIHLYHTCVAACCLLLWLFYCFTESNLSGWIQ